jgi:23S rRNA G2445 N2-methylase RlmL
MQASGPVRDIRSARYTEAMPSRRSESPLPACYAMVHRGLEEIAADEITRDLGGEVKKASRGIVAFRVRRLDERLLRLRTVEDVFLLAWGSDELPYTSAALDQIRRWTRKVRWDELLRWHHAIHPKPTGKPSYWLVTQMTGEHGYRRVDARKALAQGLEGVFPASWRQAEENAAVEVWLTIHGTQAVCGLRLSDRTMRHRPYKREHLPASLRPSVAAALVRLAGAGPGMVVVDPMMGAGTILAETAELARHRGISELHLWGGDRERLAVQAATINLRRFRPEILARWDTRHLPLPDASVDRVICNPPFGKQLAADENLDALYQSAVREWDRILKPGGRAVLLVGEPAPLLAAIRHVGWSAQRQDRLRLLGLPAFISVWRKREVAVP